MWPIFGSQIGNVGLSQEIPSPNVYRDGIGDLMDSRFALLAWTAASVAACGRTPTEPTRPPAQPPSPPVLTAIRLTGPTMLAPGATGQFTAIAERSDGSSEDVTATAMWNIWGASPDPNHTGPNVLRSTGPGTVLAIAPGEALVNVQIAFQTHNAETSPKLTVLVLEPGTFRVSGKVMSGGLPEPAMVEIVSGPGTGLGTRSNYLGEYALYGAAGPVELRASALVSGFVTKVHRLMVSDNATTDFELEPLVSPADISGAWSVTLSASPSCRAMLPQEAWQRQFDVTINQQDTHLSITRTSPTFFEACSLPTDLGRIFGQTLSFSIVGDTAEDNFVYPCLFDRLNPTQWLGIAGPVTGTVTASGIQATLDTTRGAFDSYESASTATSPFGSPPKTVCHANDHSIVFRRR
jgi:hypothetical protein